MRVRRQAGWRPEVPLVDTHLRPDAGAAAGAPRGPRRPSARPATKVVLGLILGLAVAAGVYAGPGPFAAFSDGSSTAPPPTATTLPWFIPQPPPIMKLTCSQAGRIFSCQASWDEADLDTLRWTLDGRPVTRWNNETYVRGACPVGTRRRVTAVVSNSSGSDRHSIGIDCRPYA